MLLCHLLPAVPSSPMSLAEKSIQFFLLADSPGVRNNYLCLQKFIKELC